MLSKKIPLFLLLATLVFLVPFSTEAATGTVTWDYPATAPPVTGFNLYQKKEACALNPTIPISTKILSIPAAATRTATITITVPGTYCFVMSAVNGALESGPSNKAEYILPAPPAVPAVPGNLKFIITITP